MFGGRIGLNIKDLCLCGRDIYPNLDGQNQVDSKPAGQPEHASLNQCQLIAANRPKIVALGTPSRWWRQGFSVMLFWYSWLNSRAYSN